MANLFPRVFPFNPVNTDWPTFNGNIMMYYGEELIPITSEEDWKITVKNLIQTPTFSRYNIPDPEPFQNWQDWANQFILLINGQSTN